MDIYHWIPDTLGLLYKISCMLSDSHLTAFALWHLASMLCLFLWVCKWVQFTCKLMIRDDLKDNLTTFLLFLSEWEVFQLKAIKEKSCFYLWVLLIFSSLTGKLNFKFLLNKLFWNYLQMWKFYKAVLIFFFNMLRLMKKLEHSWKALVYDGVSNFYYFFNCWCFS